MTPDAPAALAQEFPASGGRGMELALDGEPSALQVLRRGARVGRFAEQLREPSP
jgi:hypothetical protein